MDNEFKKNWKESRKIPVNHIRRFMLVWKHVWNVNDRVELGC